MKKLFVLLCTVLFAAANLFAVTKIQFDNGTALEFEGCTDGSIRFEAIGANPKSPAREFELKRTADSKEFAKNSDGNYIWNEYTVVPIEDGYKLFHNAKELYTSTFSDDGKLLRELRNWNTAREFYGFGEASRKTSLKNQSFTIYNESKYGDHAYVFIPFYITNENTAVFYNPNGKDKIFFQDGEKDAQLYRTEYKRIECFVRQDISAADSIQKFYAETESHCLLPKWAYGYIQSKYGYKSTEEVIQLIEDFKKNDIPLSAVVLDLYWFKKMGDISWTSPDFANYTELNDYMEKNNVKLITITEPFFTENCVNYKNLKKSGLLAKNTKGKIAMWRDWWCLDGDKAGGVFNPIGKNASKFMGEKYAAMLDSGIDGFWTDLGEPEAAPADVKFNKYIEQDFHNYYNYHWTKALYEGVKERKPDQRLFILSRSAGVGSGKFNVSVWSGDATVSWPSLSNQIAYGVNAGVSGLSYWGSDVGGFVQQKSPAELYVRWQQFGSFTPVYRAHGTGPREPYAYPEKEQTIVTSFIRTRMNLLPYIYSTARQTMNGVPMMRGMFMEDATTPAKYNDTQYMFGDSILVAPITTEAKTTTEKSLWLPKGTWYNFFTMEKLSSQNGKEISVKTELETIPVYIKEGAILPAEKNGTDYVFVIPAEGIKNTFTLYNDDGTTEQYKTGAFGEVTFKLDGNTLSAETNGNESFIKGEYTIAQPAGNGKYNTRKATLAELKAGLQL